MFFASENDWPSVRIIHFNGSTITVIVIIIDEWLLDKLTVTKARYLQEIIHARHHKVSTIFCSQFPPVGWYNKFPNGQIADDILDRIVHDSYLIEIQYIDKEHDSSMREVYCIKKIVTGSVPEP